MPPAGNKKSLFTFCLNNTKLQLHIKVEGIIVRDSDLSSSGALHFRRFVNLRRLVLRNCRLRGEQLPCDTLDGLERLDTLDLSNNPLRSLCP